jgi:hypothetical protein
MSRTHGPHEVRRAVLLAGRVTRVDRLWLGEHPWSTRTCSAPASSLARKGVHLDVPFMPLHVHARPVRRLLERGAPRIPFLLQNLVF